MNKQELLDLLLEYSFELHRLGLKQLAADIAFICDWFISPEWNNPIEIQTELDNPAKELISKHLQPHPAGKETIDEYSDNCPIPYDRITTVVHGYDSIKHDLLVLLLMAYGDFTSLKNIITDPIELKAIESYLSYLAITITENGGTVPPKDDDDPEPDEPIMDTLILNLYLRTEDGTTPTAVHFGSNDYWFSIVKDQKAADKLNSLGHEVVYSRDIGFGCLKYSRDEFNYEIIDVYDEDGNHVDDYGNTKNNLYVSQNNDSVLTICTRDTPINILCYTWGLKITKKDLLVLWTTIKGNVNVTVSDQTVWALFESDGSGNPHDWGNNEYDVVDYAYYPNGSNTLSWQGSSVANNYWQLVKGSNGDVRVKGNDGVRNSIAAIKLHVRSLPDEPVEPRVPMTLRRYTLNKSSYRNYVRSGTSLSTDIVACFYGKGQSVVVDPEKMVVDDDLERYEIKYRDGSKTVKTGYFSTQGNFTSEDYEGYSDELINDSLWIIMSIPSGKMYVNTEVPLYHYQTELPYTMSPDDVDSNYQLSVAHAQTTSSTTTFKVNDSIIIADESGALKIKPFVSKTSYNYTQVLVGLKPVVQGNYTITVTYKLDTTVMKFTPYRDNNEITLQEFKDLISAFDIDVNGTTYHVVASYNDSYHYFQGSSKLEIRGPGGRGLAPFIVNETYTLSNIIFN